ncbi:hypothetical protein TNCT_684481 [Trichonephila clavata]|uniref:Uncharacterized protein n=1 Tax=Trichonephila clavata TaxID=2740835 RepID=A0A8X6FQH8_TRICU|nr:hypothetical protein TNCT_684481 [Trichonephila clavata]
MDINNNAQCQHTAWSDNHMPPNTVSHRASMCDHDPQITKDQIVYQHDKLQQHQLVYVALSRVTGLDGLYKNNTRNNFKFYLEFGQASPTVR